MEGRPLFEGIATLDIGGVEHDTYMTAHVEVVDDVMVRWFGTVGWIAEGPKKLDREMIVDGTDATLSDGRSGVIRLPQHPDDSGKFEFHGVGLPPGFEPLYTRAVLPPEYTAELVSAEIRSTTLPGWRLWLGRLLAILAFTSFIAGVWMPEYRWQFVCSGLITSLVSIQLVTPAKGRQLPEVKSDGDS